ncbi:MAG: alpha-2-macroglobulin family protein [Rubrivivax sp.]
MKQYTQSARRARAAILAAVALAAALPAAATRVVQASPQGEVATVNQVLLRFDADAAVAGDPRAAAPFELRCNGQPVAGSARWLDARRWAFDLARPLPAGQRCVLTQAAGWQPSGGALQGPARFEFATGGPAVLEALPWPGGTIEEDQHFLLSLNGAIDEASVERNAHCEAEGLGERLAVRVLRGAERERVLRALRRDRAEAPGPSLLLACQRPFAPGARVRLVWGRGIAAAADGALRVRQEQRFQWTVRPRLLAEFNCERENARAACLPLAPLLLAFNAPVPRALALGVRLVPLGGGAPRMPRLDDDAPVVGSLRFDAPLPETARFQLTVPAGLVDEAGRPLANASAFPLEVATGGLPPLARFAAAPFAVVEAAARAAEPALLPMTLRHVQADLAGSAGSGSALRTLHLGPATPDATLLQWIARLQRDHDDAWRTRAQPLLAREAAARAQPLPARREGDNRATEVIGIPLPARGLHVVESDSRLLCAALLDPPVPMHARTAALVTNLGVHFKRGRSSSLVWVTALDRARPVPGAQVVVNDCHGQPLWSGRTDAQGLARIPRGFDEPRDAGDEAEPRAAGAAKPRRCTSRDGLFVTARATLDGQAELGLVFSRWYRGIEPWRFGIATAEGTVPDRRAHTVFSRSLLRTGEALHMKHFVRDETERGLARVSAAELPDEVVITHLGSDTVTRLPLPAAAWAGGRAAESTWTVPATAPLGLYDVALQHGQRRWGSGSFRVEAFRVPLVDARLSGPAADAVAPAELAFDGRLAALAGGPLRDVPATLSALLRPRSPAFAGLEDFVFEPPRSAPQADDEEPADPARVVARQLPGRTDADGRARFAVPGLPPLSGPAELQVELGFADLNGETQTVSRRWRLWPAAVVVGLRVPGWASVRNELQATAVVVDTAGRPLAGRELVLQGRQHRVLSTRTRLVGGFYAYDNRREVQELGELCRGRSDARGRLECRIDAAKLPPAGGEVELVAVGRDDAGRTSSAAARAWVSRGEPAWFAQDDDDRIDLLPEAREVEPGQSVRLQLRTPFAQATALVTVEREGVLDARLVTVRAADPVITVRVPDEAGGWSPNVVVSALLLRGRLRQAPWWSFFTWGWREPGEWWQAFRHEADDWRAPTALVDLAKPSFRMAATELRVGRRAHRLEVAVTVPQPTVKVRETVPVSVRVTREGRPVAGAELAFAAVDEGLLALAPNTSWQLLEGLLAPRPWGVATATAQGEIVGRRHYGRKAVPAGGGGGANPTRELFDTLLLWRGRVTLDANGEARIPVTMNDSLTRFRLVAVADAGDGFFGTGEAAVAVSQDLQLLPGLAPVARAGDRFEAGVTVRNTTARAMALRVTLQPRAEGDAAGEGGAIAMPPLPPQMVQLAAGASQELRWPVQVPEGATRLRWEGVAEETGGGSARASDRVAVVQAVSSPVPPRAWQASLHALDGPLTLPQAAPAGALPGSWQLRARLVPSLAGVLPEVQDWFRRYPFNCLEQQASRVLALGDRAGFERLAAELQGHLDADGLASFFPVAAGSAVRGDDKLTAYLVSAAHAAGQAWPEAVQTRLLAGLAAFVEGRLERPGARRHGSELDVRKLAALEALARHGRVVPRQLGSIAWTPAVWPTSALLDAWSLHRRVAALPQRDARLDELQRLLRSRLVAGGTTLRFADEAGDRWWWLMEGPDANAARLVLLAADEPAWRAELPLLLNGALARRQRGGWDTTTANLWGALALQRFAAVAEAGAVGGRSVLAFGGTERTVDWSGTPAGAPIVLPGPAGGAAVPLQARHDGTGRAWLALQTWAAVPLQAPLSAGYRLTRQVEAVQQRRPGVLSRGDVLRVTLEVESSQDLGWVVLADPVPAGATLLGSGLGRDAAIAAVTAVAAAPAPRGDTASPVYVERAADAWRAYFDALPRGRHRISYTLRLNTAGRFGLPPARVEAMYAPENFAELPLAVVEVQP